MFLVSTFFNNQEEDNNLDFLLNSTDQTNLFSDTGRVVSIGDGIATCTGLLNIKAGEMVIFPSTGVKGMALNLNTYTIGVVVFGKENSVRQNDLVIRSGALLEISAGSALLGRVIDALGLFIDDESTVSSSSTNDSTAVEPLLPPTYSLPSIRLFVRKALELVVSAYSQNLRLKRDRILETVDSLS
jgi:F-type H+/Na+-transporting ATPase subunit alpha